jgi:hypothetical protein
MGASVTFFPHAVFAARYAPVHQIRILSMSGNRLRGLAIPEGGLRPSAVILAAGERLFGVSIAGGFSEEAKAAGLRYGWCGFELLGLQHALALGPRSEVRCAATNRSLITLDDDGIASAANSLSTSITVEALRAAALRENLTEDPDVIWPFAEAFLQEKGPRAFIDATYLYLLGRPADLDGRSFYEKSIAEGMRPRDVWSTFVESEEFRSKAMKVLSGPFDSDFPYSLSPFARNNLQTSTAVDSGRKTDLFI